MEESFEWSLARASARRPLRLLSASIGRLQLQVHQGNGKGDDEERYYKDELQLLSDIGSRWVHYPGLYRDSPGWLNGWARDDGRRSTMTLKRAIECRLFDEERLVSQGRNEVSTARARPIPPSLGAYTKPSSRTSDPQSYSAFSLANQTANSYVRARFFCWLLRCFSSDTLPSSRCRGREGAAWTRLAAKRQCSYHGPLVLSSHYRSFEYHCYSSA